jgi:hypothetical protein
MTCDHSEALKLAQLGQWHESHAMVQPYYDRKSCLIHAYLHRVEGDLSNARYWYRAQSGFQGASQAAYSIGYPARLCLFSWHYERTRRNRDKSAASLGKSPDGASAKSATVTKTLPSC